MSWLVHVPQQQVRQPPDLRKDTDGSVVSDPFPALSSQTLNSSHDHRSGKQEANGNNAHDDFFASKRKSVLETEPDSSETEPNRKRKRDSRVPRVDLTSVDPKHRKRLEKSRKYQANKRTSKQVSQKYPDDRALQDMLLSSAGEDVS
eukprot:g56295.t1